LSETRVRATPEDDFIIESNGSTAGTLFEARYRGDPPSRLIAQTARFAVLADLAPLCAGHVLLVPRSYLPSFGALPAEWWPELEQLLARLDEAVSRAFGVPLVLEHGSSSHPQHSPCVSHAHLHLVPVEADLAPGLRSRGFAPKEVGSLRELSEIAARDCAYICWGSAQGPVQVAEVESREGIPRQYLRRELATILGSEEWDWGVPAMPELLRTTVRELSSRLGTDPEHALRG
jgi:diadenosine tetraphosphate (Ap4A) HIT family hydrolase